MNNFHINTEDILFNILSGKAVSKEDAYLLMRSSDAELPNLMRTASLIRDRESGRVISYSKNVFIPLTNICRNECGYCVFRKKPLDKNAKIMTPAEVLKTAEAGRKAGCKEALFTLGERPEELYPEVRDRLKYLGYVSMLEYLRDMCEMVFKKTGLLPHSNAGVMLKSELAELRKVNASMGLMIENISERLCAVGQPHGLSPGKHPQVRIETIESAGQLKIPFTTGLLIGIGETVEECVDSLFLIKRLNEKYGHIQEVIIQNFQAKPKTPMSNHMEPTAIDILKVVAVARLIFYDEPSIQVPPNLNQNICPLFLSAGINDWGGVSPVTEDFINPAAPWPRIVNLKKLTEKESYVLKERLPIYPKYITGKTGFIFDALKTPIKTLVDESGYVQKGGLRN